MKLPWWWRRPRVEDDERTVGEPGEGKVLMVTRRDELGEVVERTWVDADAIADWDEKRWGSSWGRR